MIVYLNGKLIPESKAFISIRDHAFLYGDGVYETLRVYNGKPFLLHEHLRRLNDSLHGIRLFPPMSLIQIGHAIEKTIEANKLKEAVVRLTITRGEGPHGFDPRPCKSPTILITGTPFKGYPRTLKKNGVVLALVSIRRNNPDAQPPRIKSISCLNGILAKIESIEADADEGLMLTQDNYLAEGTVSNIFLVKNKKLFTPQLDGHQLPGVTRELVCRLATQEGIQVLEKKLAVSDLMSANEVFITSSLMEIMPVKRLHLGGGPFKKKRYRVGEMTKRLMTSYKMICYTAPRRKIPT